MWFFIQTESGDAIPNWSSFFCPAMAGSASKATSNTGSNFLNHDLAHLCFTSSPSAREMTSRARHAANGARWTPALGHGQTPAHHKRDTTGLTAHPAIAGMGLNCDGAAHTDRLERASDNHILPGRCSPAPPPNG